MQKGIHSSLPLFILGLALLTGCDSGSNKKPNKDDTDSSVAQDSDTVTGGDSASDSSSETETDTAEVLPDLPSLCSLDKKQIPASEKDDWASDTKGDARHPTMAYGSSALMAWHYLSAEENAVWEIQMAPYDPEPDGGLPGPAEIQPGPMVNPADAGPVSFYPDLTPRGDAFGVAWQDGRFDSACKAETFTECDRQVAFLSVNGQGEAVSSSAPIQVTTDASIAAGPSIAATDTGYVVVWSEQTPSAATVMAVSVAENGTVGTPHQISAEDDADNARQPRVAALGNSIVVVWGTHSQSKIKGRTLNKTAEPSGDIQIIKDDCNCLYPNIAAGDKGFVVSWSDSTGSDYEIFTRPLDSNGLPTGEVHQATWTTNDVFASTLAWGGGKYAMAWLSSKNNGATACLVDSCKAQVLAALLDEDGQVISQAVPLSNDPNPVGKFDFDFDGTGWTVLYELPRLKRKQVFYGRMVCDAQP